MSLRVLLVDDEPLAVARVAAALRDFSDVTVVGAAHDGEVAIAMIGELQPDLVLLDIQMPGLDGLGVAAALTEAHRPEVVFITAFDQYAADAFRVEAVDYLLKPVKFDRLRQALGRAELRREMRQASGRVAELEVEVEQLRGGEAPEDAFETELWAPTLHGFIRVPVASIVWIEAARDYVLLHTSTRSYLFRATMSGLERRLDPVQMMRVHRSAFVSPAAVSEVQRQGKGLYALKLRDGTVIQVGPSYATALLAELNVDMGRLETTTG